MDTEKLAVIGRIAVAAAELEHHLDELLLELINPDWSISQVALDAPSFTPAAAMVGPLLVATGASEGCRQDLSGYVKEARAAMRQRDLVLHNHWVDDGVQMRRSRTPDDPHRRIRMEVTVPHLEDVALQIENAARAMSFAWERLITDLRRFEMVDGEARFPERVLAPDKVQHQGPPPPRPSAHYASGFSSVHVTLSAEAVVEPGGDGEH